MITASLVTYHNSVSDIERVLNSALNSCIDKIYIIDNSKTDLFRSFEQLSSKIEYIRNNNNGYGAGNNLAIKRAIELDNATYHIVLNPDIYFEKGVIEELVSYMDLNSEVGLVMPKVFYPNGELQYLCKLIPTPVDILFRWLLSPAKFKERDIRFKLLFTGYNKSMNVPYLSGCFMFFRVNALKEVGCFDERFFMHFEDLDISRRVHNKYRTMYYPSVSIVHAHAASHRKNIKMLGIGISSAIKYFNKWGWVFDKERTLVNKELLKELEYKKTK
ncbi:MAG: glycosyltransferase [Paludibacter sp.]|nr:glycosyltransferase [Paludibacter sp.]